MNSLNKDRIIKINILEKEIEVIYETGHIIYLNCNKENYQYLENEIKFQICSEIVSFDSSLEIIMEPINEFYENHKSGIFVTLASINFILVILGLNYPEKKYEIIEYIFRGMIIAPGIYGGFKIPKLIENNKFLRNNKELIFYLEYAEEIKIDLNIIKNADNFEELFNSLKKNCGSIAEKLDYNIKNELSDDFNLNFIIVNEIQLEDLIIFQSYISKLTEFAIYKNKISEEEKAYVRTRK